MTGSLKNNHVSGTYNIGAYEFATTGTGNFDVQDNVAVNDRFFAAAVSADICMRFLNNQGPTFTFSNSIGSIQIESDTFDTYNPEQGLKLSNQGTFSFSGNIDFVAPNTCSVDD